jgi:hypothetical protein
MADVTAVNGQITDSVTQTNVEVLANAPGMALSSLYQVAASAMGLAVQNAVANQQNVNNLSSAVTSKCVNFLIGTV